MFLKLRDEKEENTVSQQRFNAQGEMQATEKKRNGNADQRALTEDQVEFGVGLKSVVQCDKERRFADCFQHLALRHRVLGRLLFLNDGRLFEHFHRVQRAMVVASLFPHQKHLAVR